MIDATQAPVPVAGENLGAIKAYLLEHSEALATSTTTLAEQGER